jgi:hypothetical protein
LTLGFGHNAANPFRGAAGAHLNRLLRPIYADGISKPVQGLNERVISRLLFEQNNQPDTEADTTATALQLAFGQFLSHDMVDSSIAASPIEPYDITNNITAEQAFKLQPDDIGTIPFERSSWDRVQTGNVVYPREQLNHASSYIDGSAIYGPSNAHVYRLVRGCIR